MSTRIALPTAATRRPTADATIQMPGHRAPAAGFEDPFDMLGACHERVQRMLNLLQRLQAHLLTVGWDEQAVQAATDVMRYFDQAAPLHHQDEELHVFPLLLAAPDKQGLHAAVQRLQQDHRQMEAHWPLVRVVLLRIQHHTAGTDWPALSEEEVASLGLFVGLYGDHIDTEDCLVYPAALARMDAADLQHMGRAMMARRGLVITA